MSVCPAPRALTLKPSCWLWTTASNYDNDYVSVRVWEISSNSDLELNQNFTFNPQILMIILHRIPKENTLNTLVRLLDYGDRHLLETIEAIASPESDFVRSE